MTWQQIVGWFKHQPDPLVPVETYDPVLANEIAGTYFNCPEFRCDECHRLDKYYTHLTSGKVLCSECRPVN